MIIIMETLFMNVQYKCKTTVINLSFTGSLPMTTCIRVNTDNTGLVWH